MNSTTDEYESCNDEKIKDIKRIIELYEERLSQGGSDYDYAEALKIGCCILNKWKNNKNYKYGVVKGTRLTEREKEFLALLSNNEWEEICYLSDNEEIKAERKGIR